MTDSFFLAILTSEEQRPLAEAVASGIGVAQHHVLVGTAADAAAWVAQQNVTATHILMELDARGHDMLPEIDQLAEQCTIDTSVVVIGQTNDITLYRELIARGVAEYFPLPVEPGDLVNAFKAAKTPAASAPTAIGGQTPKQSKVITFISAASGDGSSTVALNTAYCLATNHHYRTVIIDMDFQFGMIARNLDLTTQYGIRDLFEHQDRSIDETLISRMLVEYKPNLHVIAAPNDLRLWPDIYPDMVSELISTLRNHFDFVIIDLPHIWSQWQATALTLADQNVIIAQLWLRSVTHTARMLAAWADISINDQSIFTVINRSGAKFKEAVSAKDYENVCRRKINFYMSNDIRSTSAAENEGKTVVELNSGSPLIKEFGDLTLALIDAVGLTEDAQNRAGGSLNQTSTKDKLSLKSLFNK